MPNVFAYDPSNERSNFAIPGLQHKYRETVLLFVAQDCHSICDWCFRKRIFEGESLSYDTVVNADDALDYIREHTEVRSVLMTGGDALLARPDLLKTLCDGIAEMDHIHNIRFGTRALVHDPDHYAEVLPRYGAKKTYVVLHIVRPREVRPALKKVIERFPGYSFLVQTPLLRGINDDSEVLAELWYECARAGLQPYYVFQNRPTIGNEKYGLTFREGHDVFSGAQALCTGVVKTPRYVMSNKSGKWEIVGMDSADEVILRCHQGVNPLMVGTLRSAVADEVWWDLPEDDRYLTDISGTAFTRVSGD